MTTHAGKVLVVDDDMYLRSSTAQILRLAGFDVDEAANGYEALTALKAKKYEAILLDLKMPGLSGEEVLRRLSDVAPEVEVVLLTAHGTLDSAILALRKGAVDFLTKPANADEIVQAISKAVNTYRERHRQQELLGRLEQSIQELKGVAGKSKTAEDKTNYTPQQSSLPPTIKVDWERRIISWKDKKIYLTPAESRLFRVLWDAQGKVVNHGDIVRRVHGYNAEPWEAPEITRPLVSRLRAKLSKIPGGEKWIANVRGTGYVLEIPDDIENSNSKPT